MIESIAYLGMSVKDIYMVEHEKPWKAAILGCVTSHSFN